MSGSIIYAYVGGNPVSYIDPEGKNLTLGGVIVVGGIIYGGYKLYQKFAKFDNDVQSCKLQCENVAACGNPERTGQYSDNAARCIATCKSYSTISDFFGIGKGPTGPKSPDPTPDYFKGIPPADGRP